MKPLLKSNLLFGHNVQYNRWDIFQRFRQGYYLYHFPIAKYTFRHWKIYKHYKRIPIQKVEICLDNRVSSLSQVVSQSENQVFKNPLLDLPRLSVNYLTWFKLLDILTENSLVLLFAELTLSCKIRYKENCIVLKVQKNEKNYISCHLILMLTSVCCGVLRCPKFLASLQVAWKSSQFLWPY